MCAIASNVCNLFSDRQNWTIFGAKLVKKYSRKTSLYGLARRVCVLLILSHSLLLYLSLSLFLDRYLSILAVAIVMNAFEICCVFFFRCCRHIVFISPGAPVAWVLCKAQNQKPTFGKKEMAANLL